MVEALRRDPDFQIVSSELNAASLLAASSSQRIDVFVLNAFAEEDAQREFRIQGLRAGAKGLFDHHESLDMLRLCIRLVHEGQVWLNNEQMALVLESL
jgi:hypothetical protein